VRLTANKGKVIGVNMRASLMLIITLRNIFGLKGLASIVVLIKRQNKEIRRWPRDSFFMAARIGVAKHYDIFDIELKGRNFILLDYCLL